MFPPPHHPVCRAVQEIRSLRYRVIVTNDEAVALNDWALPAKANSQSVPHMVKAGSAEANRKEVLKVLPQSEFPWICPTAISDQVFEDGVFEFIVELGSGGILGFCDASFVDEVSRIFEHWARTANHGHVWLLHSSGFFVSGPDCTHAPNAKFLKGDCIKIVLDLFKEEATFSRSIGDDILLGKVNDINISMFRCDDKISIINFRETTEEMDTEHRAFAMFERGKNLCTRAANLRYVPGTPNDQLALKQKKKLLLRSQRMLEHAATYFTEIGRTDFVEQASAELQKSTVSLEALQ